MNYLPFALSLCVICVLGSLRYSVLTWNEGFLNKLVFPISCNLIVIIPTGSLGYFLFYVSSFWIVKGLAVVACGGVVILWLVFTNGASFVESFNDLSFKSSPKKEIADNVIHCDNCMSCPPLTVNTAYSIGHDGSLPKNHKTGVYRICCEESFKRLYLAHGHDATSQAIAKSQSIAVKHLKYRGKC
jgi:hypothetical protein